MNELYWLTRLDAIDDVTSVACILSIVAIVISVVALVSATATLSPDDEEPFFTCPKKIIKIAFPVFIVAGLLQIFVPTTKEALVIYGIGGAYDYVREDSTAQQIPHKVIEACDAYLDELIKENKDKK